jgi:hypothetical protein
MVVNGKWFIFILLLLLVCNNVTSIDCYFPKASIIDISVFTAGSGVMGENLKVVSSLGQVRLGQAKLG